MEDRVLSWWSDLERKGSQLGGIVTFGGADVGATGADYGD
jgi:hypothetical protein